MVPGGSNIVEYGLQVKPFPFEDHSIGLGGLGADVQVTAIAPDGGERFTLTYGELFGLVREYFTTQRAFDDPILTELPSDDPLIVGDVRGFLDELDALIGGIFGDNPEDYTTRPEPKSSQDFLRLLDGIVLVGSEARAVADACEETLIQHERAKVAYVALRDKVQDSRIEV